MAITFEFRKAKMFLCHNIEFFGVGGSTGVISGWSKSKMAAGRRVEKFRMAIYLSNGSLDPLHVWFHVGLIMSTARKDRAFKFYTDLGTEEHNKICTQNVP